MIGPTFQIKDPYVSAEFRKLYHLLQQRVRGENLDLSNVAAALAKVFGDGQIEALNRFLTGRYTGARIKISTPDSDDNVVYIHTTGSQPLLYLDIQGSATHPLETSISGCFLSSGGVWTSTSARDQKTNVESLDLNAIHELIRQLPLYRWEFLNRKTLQPSGEKHLGPMAEEFHALFKIGYEKGLSATDVASVALAGLQWALKRIDDLETRLQVLEARDADD